MEYRRRLPHRHEPGTDLFLTWNLYGSLPQPLYPPPGSKRAGHAFVWMDRYLDQTLHGPHFLRIPEVAAIVEGAIHEGALLGRYSLHAYVIMSNHVHLLIRPAISASEVMRRLKGASARAANVLLRRTGEPFWQSESYDHWVRNEAEFARIRAYIENNPVKAGLVASPDQYRWSSASGASLSLLSDLQSDQAADQSPPAA